ncbi:hypothetical protein [Desulfobacula sp.]
MNTDHYFLQPGYIVVPEPFVSISTVIGSGVSICIYDKQNRIGGMNPLRYGDMINRFTTPKAQKENAPASGIELGPFGTFTLRVVHPWVMGGKTAGYIELGMEIKHITPEIKKYLARVHKIHSDKILCLTHNNKKYWFDRNL